MGDNVVKNFHFFFIYIYIYIYGSWQFKNISFSTIMLLNVWIHIDEDSHTDPLIALLALYIFTITVYTRLMKVISVRWRAAIFSTIITYGTIGSCENCFVIPLIFNSCRADEKENPFENDLNNSLFCTFC